MNADRKQNQRLAKAVTLSEDSFVVEAELVARNLGLSPDAFWQQMKRGAIHGQVERGEGEDLGHARLTFRYRGRSWAVVVDDMARSG